MKKGIILVPFMSGFGGTETVLKNLFNERKNVSNSYNLNIYSLGGSTDYTWTKGIPITIRWISSIRVIRTLYYLFIMPFNLFFYLRKRKPDFVISTNPVMWFLARKILPRTTPVIAWYHYSLAQKPIKTLFLNSADFYLAISSGIKKQLVDKGINKNKIFTIFNPVVSNTYIIKRPTKSVKFIYLGRLSLDGQKNLRELMDALEGINGNWTLELYGDQSTAQGLRKYVLEKDINSHIKWCGFVENPWQSIDSATALLLTSKYEGLPMVLCEAITHGVYCVSANTKTGPDDIINRNNGQLYHLGDVKELHFILQSIVDGVTLPPQEKITNSAKKFSASQYLERFDYAIDTITRTNHLN
ncbi:glycosyltransferase [Limosilactobacillus vaginalis]|uniref:glycosyltransferase n=1 Tax=Limosilactobacillus vaginalis TaxID=1633 RepID=UPI003F1E5BB2